jgi:phospholipid/cholesterol/gamma-HCH transport system substrate-binding protein
MHRAPENDQPSPEETFRFKHVHAITGTFVLGVLALLIAVLALAGRSQRWFIRNVPLGIILPEEGAAGIRHGSEVYFLGTLVGTVSDVTVDPAGRMEAEVNIRKDFFLFVRADSSAVVKRKFGVIGDAYFEITRGHGQPLPEKNAAIVCNQQISGLLETAVEELRREALPVLKKTSEALTTWTTLASNLMSTRQELDKLLARGNAIAAGLEEGKGTVGELLSDSTTSEELRSLIHKATAGLADFETTIRNLNEASADWRAASTNLPLISGLVAAEARQLPGLVDQTQTSMRELERLTEALQQHWLWRKYINLTNPPPPFPSRRRK